LLKHLYEAWVVNLNVLKAEDLCFRDFGLHWQNIRDESKVNLERCHLDVVSNIQLLLRVTKYNANIVQHYLLVRFNVFHVSNLNYLERTPKHKL
jgi:hypothetical protein